jgi:putative DNA primase/helicase
LTFENTDLGSAERLIHNYGDRILDCRDEKGWYLWDGTKWKLNINDAEVTEFAKETARRIAQEPHKSAKKWSESSQSKSKITSMYELAKSDERIRITSNMFDRQPTDWLLNVSDGTVDMTTGTLLSHNPENLITMQANVRYDEDAACPRWQAFVREVLGGDTEVSDYVQRLLGNCLIAGNQDQVFPIFHGDGANGKSTMLNVLGHLLDDYAKAAQVDTFMDASTVSPRPDLIRLNRARLVIVTEVNPGDTLSESLVKQMTGGDVLAARDLYKGTEQFKPKLLPIMAANYLPRVSGDSYAIWRRLKVIPFGEPIPPAQRDPKLQEKLLAEGSGILNWLIEGALKWKQRDLQTDVPTAVAEATDAYKPDLEWLNDFLKACCTPKTGGRTRTTDLYVAYKVWIEKMGPHAMKKNDFQTMMEQEGFKRTKSCYKYYRGLDLVDPPLRDQYGKEMQCKEIPAAS